jgi:hypothetical protein
MKIRYLLFLALAAYGVYSAGGIEAVQSKFNRAQVRVTTTYEHYLKLIPSLVQKIKDVVPSD